jgi:hypothetical protein
MRWCVCYCLGSCRRKLIPFLFSLQNEGCLWGLGRYQVRFFPHPPPPCVY